MNKISRSISLEPRDEHFHFDAVAERDWHGGDPVKTVIFNALSIMFPEGEKFFMDSVKQVRGDIDDPVLQSQIKGFLVQEAMHTREHVGYNKQLDKQGYRATELHLQLRKRLKWVREKFGPKRQLASTCALEHFTAMMSDQLMMDPQYLEGADGEFKKVWLWHAIEEAEHKGVAFDALQAASKGNTYFLRCRTMIMVTIIFNYFILKHFGWMLKDIGLSRSPKAWAKVGWFLLGKPGLYRRMFLPWCDYFRPGFHPWDHDNRGRLAKTEQALLGQSAYAEHIPSTEAIAA